MSLGSSMLTVSALHAVILGNGIHRKDKRRDGCMNNQLKDKVILLTGAAGQLGQGAVRLFLERGAIVVGTDIISIDQSEKLANLQKEYGSERFYFMQSDSSEEKQVKSAFAEVKKRFGKLDGVFHNAYRQAVQPMVDLPLEEWDAAMKGSLTSTFLMNKYAVAEMIKQGHGGSIVNTSSVLSHIPKLQNAAYGAAKAGINQFTRVVALENSEHKIRANVLVPGDFKSEENLSRLDPEALKNHNNNFLLNRTGSPEDMAEMAAFLLSDAACYVTGSLMTVDGGYSLHH